jgi:hypothetical protein
MSNKLQEELKALEIRYEELAKEKELYEGWYSREQTDRVKFESALAEEQIKTKSLLEVIRILTTNREV